VITIDWSSATVSDAQLTVTLAGTPPAKFKDQVEDVIGQLRRSGSAWGEIAVGKRKLTVDSVSPGAEGDLRHFLESALLQASTSAGVEDEDEDEDESGPDAEMTAKFRSFAD
jgi:hypothetical protein